MVGWVDTRRLAGDGKRGIAVSASWGIARRHEHWIGKTQCGKAEEGGDDEKQFSQSEGVNAD